MGTLEPTLCSAIILSDAVIREEGTHKLSLIGCFNNISLPKFPFHVPPFVATAFITNLRGSFKELNLTARIENAKTGHVLTSTTGRIGLRDEVVLEENEVVEMPFPLAPCVAPEPGVYTVVVLADNEVIGKRFFTVKPVTTARGPVVQ